MLVIVATVVIYVTDVNVTVDIIATFRMICVYVDLVILGVTDVCVILVMCVPVFNSENMCVTVVNETIDVLVIPVVCVCCYNSYHCTFCC